MPYPTSNLDYGGGVVDNPDASNIDIDDVGGHYDGNTVEEALAELGPVFDNIQGSADVDDAVIAAAISDDTPSASYTAVFANPTFTGNVVVPNAADADTATAAQRTAVDSTLGRLAIDNAEIGDTGWRDVTGDLLNSWSATGIRLRRTGSTVHLMISNLSGASKTDNALLTLPSGFRRTVEVGTATANRAYWLGAGGRDFFLTDTIYFNIQGTNGDTVEGGSAVAAQYADASWTTSDAWPTSLPGTQSTAPLDPTA